MPGKKSAGNSIESYCGKCKQNRDHTIMTMNGEAITKVRCATCGSLHKFCDPAARRKVRKPGAKTVAEEEATTAIIWETGLAEAKGKERDYDMASKYRVGEVVNHTKFGKGIVLKIYDNKCAMLFKDR